MQRRQIRPSVGREHASNYFTIRVSDGEKVDPHGTLLKDDAAALNHTCHNVRELQPRTVYDYTVLVGVRDEMQRLVLSIPFLAAPDL